MIIQKPKLPVNVTIFKAKIPSCQVCRYSGFSTRCVFFETGTCIYDDAIKSMAKTGYEIN
jgi:hypothetical protein